MACNEKEKYRTRRFRTGILLLIDVPTTNSVETTFQQIRKQKIFTATVIADSSRRESYSLHYEFLSFLSNAKIRGYIDLFFSVVKCMFHNPRVRISYH